VSVVAVEARFEHFELDALNLTDGPHMALIVGLIKDLGNVREVKGNAIDLVKLFQLLLGDQLAIVGVEVRQVSFISCLKFFMDHDALGDGSELEPELVLERLSAVVPGARPESADIVKESLHVLSVSREVRKRGFSHVFLLTLEVLP